MQANLDRPCLTQREAEVLGRIVAGDRRKQIAFALGISNRTIDAHMDKIKLKLGARNVADMVRITLENSLLGDGVAT
jgi:two-component system response regulator FixJ